MDFVDYYVRKMNNLKNKFVVYVVDSDSDSDGDDEDSSCHDDALSYTHYLITNHCFKHYELRTPKFSEFSAQDLLILGNTGLFGAIILYNSQSIIFTLFKILYTASLFTFGVCGSCIVVSFLIHKNELSETMINEETEYQNSLSYKYGLFINKHYDVFEKIYNDSNMLENEYTNEDETFLGELKDKDKHCTFDIPIEKNSKLIMFYHSGDDAFHYYTQNSDVLYIVLNACCRDYVYKYKCLNLFVDEEEIEFIKSSDESKSEEIEDIIDSYENISEDEDEKQENKEGNKEENKEEKPENKSLFYNKNEKKEKKESKEINKQINKFIRKGNLSDYESKFKEKLEKKQINYNDFKALFDQTIEK